MKKVVKKWRGHVRLLAVIVLAGATVGYLSTVDNTTIKLVEALLLVFFTVYYILDND